MSRLATIPIAACLLALSHVPAMSAGGPSTSRSCLPATLKSMLAAIESRYGPVQVISTYRPGARIAGTSYPSLHASCRAVDFHPAPGKYREVLAYVRDQWNGGIGTYSGQLHHLHLDMGSKKIWHTRATWPRTTAGDRPATRAFAARKRNGTNGFHSGANGY